VDDVAAVRIAAQMHRFRRIELKAMMLSVPFEDAAKALHGQLRYEGFRSMPIGVSGPSAGVTSPFWSDFIDKYYADDGFDKRDSVELYKEILRDCAAKNEKIRIVTTGFLVNIEKLLRDSEGYSLVDKCVEDIWITGGSYPEPGMDYNFYISEETRKAAKYVFENAPVELVYSVGQMASDGAGKNILCGGTLYGIDSSDIDPIRVAYKAYEAYGGADLSKGHMSWDPLCVWAASLTNSETQTRIVGVNGSFDDVGRNSFVAANNPLRGVLEKTSLDGSWYSGQLDYYINMGYHYPDDWYE
jgi:inosine-uridine nucleoside N-ribohydrolase